MSFFGYRRIVKKTHSLSHTCKVPKYRGLFRLCSDSAIYLLGKVPIYRGLFRLCADSAVYLLGKVPIYRGLFRLCADSAAALRLGLRECVCGSPEGNTILENCSSVLERPAVFA